MKTYIVLADVNSFNRKTFVENVLDNKNFDTFDEFQNFIDDKREMTNGCYNLLYFDLSEFMDACNDQEINLELWWLSYVNVLET